MRREHIDIIWFTHVVMHICTSAYPSGAPEAACEKFSPDHHTYSQQSTDCPYTISTSSSSYYPGKVIKVSVNGTVPFKGLILQAKQIQAVSNTNFKDRKPEGKFEKLPESLQYLTCNNLSNSTVTHTNSGEKHSVQVNWVAPNEYRGNIKFYATIVQNISTYWEKERSVAVVEEPRQQTTELMRTTSVNGHSTERLESLTSTINTPEVSYTGPSSTLEIKATERTMTHISGDTREPTVTTKDFTTSPKQYMNTNESTTHFVKETTDINNLNNSDSTIKYEYTTDGVTTRTTHSTTTDLYKTTENDATGTRHFNSNISHFYTTYITTVSDKLDSTTELITDVLTEDYDRNSSLTEAISQKTTTVVGIESVSGKPITMVTKLKDTSVLLKMTITSIEFTDTLTDKSTVDFMELEKSIRKTMEDIYSSWTGFEECKIIGFSQGSVISETELVFNTVLSDDDKASTVGELYNLVAENGAIGNYSVSDIQSVGSDGTYVVVDPCFILPCPADLYCYEDNSKCVLSCKDNPEFCPDGECSVNEDGKNLICSNATVTNHPTSNNSNELTIIMVLIGVSVFLIVLSIVLFVFLFKSWSKRRQRWQRRRRPPNDIQLYGFEDNRHTRLNGGVPGADIPGTPGTYFVETSEPTDLSFFSSHPVERSLSGRGSIGSISQHSIFDRAFSRGAQSDLFDEHDYDYDVIGRNRSVTFIEIPQIMGDDQSAEEFGIENFSFGVPKYVDREDDGGSYRVRWDFKIDNPTTADMDIAL